MDTPKLERLKCHEVSMFQNKSRVCPQIFLCCWYTLRSTQFCTTPRRNPPKQFANPCPAPSPPKNDSGPTIAILIKKGTIMPSIIPLHPWNLTVSIYLQENASQASWTLYKGPTTPNATSFPPKKPMPTIKRSPYPPSFPQQGLNIWRVWCRIIKNTPPRLLPATFESRIPPLPDLGFTHLFVERAITWGAIILRKFLTKGYDVLPRYMCGWILKVIEIGDG